MAYNYGTNVLIDGNSSLRHSGFSTQTGTLASTQVKIKPSTKQASGFFGMRVAVGCGRIIVGAQNWDSGKGRAWIFDLDGNELKVLTPADLAAGDGFGTKIAIGCGRIAIASPLDDDKGSNSGSVYIYDLNGTQIAKIKASDGAANDYFGDSVSIGSGKIVVGAPNDDDAGSNTGAAYIFNLNGTQLKKIKGGTTGTGVSEEWFGSRVAVNQGRIAVSTSNNTKKVYIFNLDGYRIKTISNTATGYAAGALAINCGRIVVGAWAFSTNFNTVWIYDLNGTQIATASPSDGSQLYFGWDAAISQGYIFVGSYGSSSSRGAFYQYDLNGTQIAKILSSDGAANDFFGYGMGAGNARVVGGAYGDDDDALAQSGSMYIYKLSENMDSHFEDVAEYYRR